MSFSTARSSTLYRRPRCCLKLGVANTCFGRDAQTDNAGKHSVGCIRS
jgi:hypothetical protein